MKIGQRRFADGHWQPATEPSGFNAQHAQIVLAFGERNLLDTLKPYAYLRELYPAANIVINSTSGEIFADKVHDNTIVVTAIELEKSTVRTAQIDITDH